MTQDQFIEKWNVGYEDFEQKAEFAQDMKNDLASLKLAEGSQWVKVEDGMPEVFEDVSFINMDVENLAGEKLKQVNSGYYAGNQVFHSWLSKDKFTATHWQPKPAPPTK
jgi:hypothetical protein